MNRKGFHSFGKKDFSYQCEHILYVSPFSFFSLKQTTRVLSPQLPYLMTLWSVAEESVWPSRWPKITSTEAVIAPPLASWRWTSLNC